MYNDINEKDNFLKAIADLEQEINIFENRISKAVKDNEIGKNALAISENNHAEIDHDFEIDSEVDDDDEQNNLQAEFKNLSSAFFSLKKVVEDLKKQVASPASVTGKQTNEIVKNEDFDIQMGKLIDYMDRRFSDFEKKQQKRTTDEKNDIVNVKKQQTVQLPEKKEVPKEEPLQNNNSNINEFVDTEGQIKKISNQYSDFINKLRNECLTRIRKEISVASDEVVHKEGFATKKISDVIAEIVDRERTYFQNILRELNQRVLSTLDDNFTVVINENNQAIFSGKNFAPKTEKPLYKKNLMDELNAIQSKIDDNLAKQNAFFPTNKN